jgi:hypothetical protein
VAKTAVTRADVIFGTRTVLVLTRADLTDTDRDRLAGQILDTIGKGARARNHLNNWLDRLNDHAHAGPAREPL